MLGSGAGGKKPIKEAEKLRPQKAKLERVSHYITKDKKAGTVLQGIGVGVEQARRKTGIDIIGDVTWGGHFCVFYQSKQDLIDILVPYFKAGLENNEFCMWITSEPLNAKDAKESLKGTVRNLDSYIRKGQIEILDYSQWYTKSGKFETDRVLQGWVQKHDDAIARGFDGLRLTGNTFWLEKKDWAKFAEYEAMINKTIGKYHMMAICTYSLDKCDTSEILDVEQNHQFALFKWQGDWKILQSTTKNQLQARLTEQTAITQALERSKKDWENTFNAISDWVVLMDLKGRILRTNPIGEEFVGVPVAGIAGQTCCKLVHGSDTPLPGCPLLKMLQSGRSEAMELQLPNSNRWLAITTDPVRDENGTLVGAVHITREITGRKLFETEQELTIELLHLLNATNQKHELMELVTKFLKDWSECEAIGIRLQEGEDFPYYVTSGFPEEFILAETKLCAVNELGEIERDSQGRAYLECMCGNVISGRFDPSKPFFTEHGSFWTNSTTELLATTTNTDRMARTRNRCNTAGYESVALIPLRAGRETFGLLQFNDKQKGRFTPEKISMFERLADSLALGLAQCRAEEALRKREELHELFFSQSLDGFFYMMFDEPIRWDDTVDKEKVLDYVFAHHRITKVNDAMLQQYGASREQYIGLTPNDLYAHDIAYGRGVWRDFLDSGRLHLETDERKLDGTPIWIEGDYLCLYDSQGRITGHFGVQREITEEKRAREALRESEQKYRALVEQSLQGIVILQDFQIVFANPTAAKIAGLTVDEVLALTPEDIKAFMPAEERAAILQRYEERLADKPVEHNYELRLVRKNGDEFWLDVFVSQIEYLGKSAIQIAFIDITQRKKAEEEKTKLLKAIETAEEAVFITALDGRFIYTNNAMDELFGYKKGELLGKYPPILNAGPEPEAVAKRIMDTIKKADVWEGEIHNKRKDGTEFTSYARISAVKDTNGRILNFVSTQHDITERKRAEEAYRTLVDHSLQGLAILQDERVVFTNQALADITGYTVEEMLAMTPEQVQAFVHPDGRELVWSRHKDRLNGEEPPERYEFRGIRKDGSTCWLELHASRIEYQGKPAIQVAYVDITERKKAEEALTKSEENYHSIFDTANDAIFIHDLKDGTILDVNEKMLEMYGFANKKEIVGSFIGKLSSAKKPYTVEDAGKWIRKAIKEGPQLFEWNAKDKKGRLFWVEVNLKKAVIGGNDRILAIVRDITKRKKTEEQIAKLAKFPAENPNPVLRISGRGTVVYANKASANLLKTWDCRVGKSVKDRWHELVMDSLSSGQSQQTEVKCEGRIFSLTFAPVVKANYVNVYGHDITERKKAEQELARALAWQEAIFEGSRDAVFVSDANSRFVIVNRAACELTGYSKQELLQIRIPDLHEKEDLAAYNLFHERIMAGEEIVSEAKILRKDGTKVDAEFNNRRITISGTTYMHTAARDITERKKAEEEIQNLAKFPSENPNVVFRVSKKGSILYANRAGEILLSYRKCFDNDKTVSKEWLKLITEALSSKSDKAFEFECKNRFYSFIIAPVAEGGYANFYGRDITKRKKAEERLLEHQAKLKAMASEMLLTEERERQRLAVGLHDEVCQKLVLTKLALESSLQLVSDSKVLASLRIVCEGIGETIEQADSLTFELSNPVLRQLGFVIALEKYLTEEIQQKHGIEYELESDEQLGALQDEIKNCLFRVTRELLTNVVKHAHARKVKVSVRKSQSQIYVRVQDDGVGFKESQASATVFQTARFGLFSIREQLEYLGGHLEIESEPGRGTTATVVVPLRDKATV